MELALVADHLPWMVPVSLTIIGSASTIAVQGYKIIQEHIRKVEKALSKIPLILDKLNSVEDLAIQNQLDIRRVSGRLATTMNQFPLPTFVCDLHGYNLSVNDAYRDTLECGREELMGMNWLNFCKNPDVWANITEQIMTDTREAFVELHLETKVTHKALVFQCYLYPIKNGTIKEYYGSLKQIGPN